MSLVKALLLCSALTFLGYPHYGMTINTNHQMLNSKEQKTLELVNALNSIISKSLKTFNIPGAAVGLIVDQKILLENGYGSIDLETNQPATANSLFCIASCTKAFTALLLAQLAEEGKISWDEPVISYLPEFRLFSPELTNQVTIRDLIAHRTGIARHDPVWIFSQLPQRDAIQILPHLEPTYPLRETFQYNNFMYAIAGKIIEKVTGASWENNLKTRIFLPLKMENSSVGLSQQPTDQLSFPYAEIEGTTQKLPFRNLDIVAPGGGIYSCLSDLLKWVQLHLNQGKIKDHSLLKAKTLEEMTAIHMNITSTKPQNGINHLGYGLGWFISEYKGHRLINHSGEIDGFTSEIAFLPEHKIGIVLLTNSSTDGRYFIATIRNSILDALLQLKPSNWLTKVQQARNVAKHTLVFPDLPKYIEASLFDQYLGHYEHPAYGLIEIKAENNQLVAYYKNSLIPLIPTAQHLFKGKFPLLIVYGINPYIDFSFSISTEENIDQLEVSFEGFRLANPIKFIKLVN